MKQEKQENVMWVSGKKQQSYTPPFYNSTLCVGIVLYLYWLEYLNVGGYMQIILEVEGTTVCIKPAFVTFRFVISLLNLYMNEDLMFLARLHISYREYIVIQQG